MTGEFAVPGKGTAPFPVVWTSIVSVLCKVEGKLTVLSNLQELLAGTGPHVLLAEPPRQLPIL